MSLTAGTRIGPYEVTGPLGAGGMGEVYRAHDGRLKRDVALKVLPASFGADPDRIARFQREAEVLASLNHPHIAQVYGLEDAGGVTALVMELVEGPTLADRIAQGPIAVDEALAIATQIAGALAAAHERGIVHRDLKPANVKVRADGTVKVLDFGLAKALAPEPSSAAADVSPTMSPTMATPVRTVHGLILGTAAYMSPEQARGRPVDRRADIWAFGVVVYEMVTGRRPFDGEDLTETLAAVVKDRPDLSRVPPQVRRLIEACLEKDPRQRLQDLGDSRWLIDAGAPVAPPGRRPWSRSLWPASIAAALLLALAAVGWSRAGRTVTAPPNLTLTIVPAPDAPMDPLGSLMGTPEIAPDGSAVLYSAPDGLYVRRLDSNEAILVPGSREATNNPFWSPDSRSVLYPNAAAGELIRVRLPDGAPERVMPLPGFSRGGSQNAGGAILLSSLSALHLMPQPGGSVERLDLSALGDGAARYPEFLPDGRSFLFLWTTPSASEVYLATLENGRVVDPVSLLRNETAARYTPAGGGRILFVRDDTLYAQPLDLEGRRLTGDAVLVERRVGSSPGMTVRHAAFSVSRDGHLVWRSGTAALSQVTAFTRDGDVIGTTGPPLAAGSLQLSPDETRLLAVGERSWLLDVGQPASLALPADVPWRFWSPDGSTLLGVRDGVLLERALIGDGRPREIGRVEAPGILQALSPDGGHLLTMRTGVGVIDLEGPSGDRVVRMLVELATGEGISGQGFSPDGRWIVYRSVSSATGGGGVFVQPFPGPGLRRQIAAVPGYPFWRGDGREILVQRGETLYAIAVNVDGEQLRFGPPVERFSGLRAPAGSNISHRPLAVTRDGSRIFWLMPVEQPGSDVIHIRTNAVP